MEKRRFQRVRYTTRCTLTHNGMIYHGRTENLSLNGALISFSDGIIVPKGEQCSVLVFPEEEEAPLKLEMEVVYAFYTMLGTKIVSVDPETQRRLLALVERMVQQPDKLQEELERVREQVADYVV